MTAKKKAAKVKKGARAAARRHRAPATTTGAPTTPALRICKSCGAGTVYEDRCRACGGELGKAGAQ